MLLLLQAIGLATSSLTFINLLLLTPPSRSAAFQQPATCLTAPYRGDAAAAAVHDVQWATHDPSQATKATKEASRAEPSQHEEENEKVDG